MRNKSTEVRSEPIPWYLGKDEGQYSPWLMPQMQLLKFILNIIYQMNLCAQRATDIIEKNICIFLYLSTIANPY